MFGGQPGFAKQYTMFRGQPGLKVIARLKIGKKTSSRNFPFYPKHEHTDETLQEQLAAQWRLAEEWLALKGQM